MDITYRNELITEPTAKAKSAIIHLVWAIPQGGALDRLTDDQTVPAAEVLRELDDLLALKGEITRKYVDEERAELDRFRAIVARRVEQEKADKIADRLVRQVLKAGLGYSRAQRLFVRALDRQSDKFPLEGW